MGACFASSFLHTQASLILKRGKFSLPSIHKCYESKCLLVFKLNTEKQTSTHWRVPTYPLLYIHVEKDYYHGCISEVITVTSSLTTTVQHCFWHLLWKMPCGEKYGSQHSEDGHIPFAALATAWHSLLPWN